MTSNPAAVPHSFRITSGDLIDGALNRPGIVRVDKIYTLAKSILVRKFGKASPLIIDRIRQTLSRVIAADS